MEIGVGDRVFDLHGGLGIGTVEDIYTNYHDDPKGEVLAVCRFEAEEGSEAEPTICDRSFDQITLDLPKLALHATPRGMK